jgi:hypothetical protein
MKTITQNIALVDSQGIETIIHVDNGSDTSKDFSILQGGTTKGKELSMCFDHLNKILSINDVKLEGLTFDVFMNFINQK